MVTVAENTVDIIAPLFLPATRRRAAAGDGLQSRQYLLDSMVNCRRRKIPGDWHELSARMDGELSSCRLKAGCCGHCGGTVSLELVGGRCCVLILAGVTVITTVAQIALWSEASLWPALMGIQLGGPNNYFGERVGRSLDRRRAACFVDDISALIRLWVASTTALALFIAAFAGYIWRYRDDLGMRYIRQPQTIEVTVCRISDCIMRASWLPFPLKPARPL